MKIEMRFFGKFRDEIGQRTLKRSYEESPTIRTVFIDFEDDFPNLEGSLLDDQDECHPMVAVILNGRNIVHEQGLKTRLVDGDVLGITPPLAGGSGRAVRELESRVTNRNP